MGVELGNRLLFDAPVPLQISSKVAPLKVGSQGFSQGTPFSWLCSVKISLTLETVKTQNEALESRMGPSWSILASTVAVPQL